MYYLYGIRGAWSPVVKIGYYVADIDQLRRRYSTAYGPDLVIDVFEVASKQYVRLVERSIHSSLKKAGFHIGGELFQLDCMDLFIARASLLCRRYVRAPEGKTILLEKRVREKQRIAQRAAEEQATKAREEEARISISNAGFHHLPRSTQKNYSKLTMLKQSVFKGLLKKKGISFSTKNWVYKGLVMKEEGIGN